MLKSQVVFQGMRLVLDGRFESVDDPSHASSRIGAAWKWLIRMHEIRGARPYSIHGTNNVLGVCFTRDGIPKSELKIRTYDGAETSVAFRGFRYDFDVADVADIKRINRCLSAATRMADIDPYVYASLCLKGASTKENLRTFKGNHPIIVLDGPGLKFKDRTMDLESISTEALMKFVEDEIFMKEVIASCP